MSQSQAAQAQMTVSDMRIDQNARLAQIIGTRILGRRTAPFPPFPIPHRVPHGFLPKILVLTPTILVRQTYNDDHICENNAHLAARPCKRTKRKPRALVCALRYRAHVRISAASRRLTARALLQRASGQAQATRSRL